MVGQDGRDAIETLVDHSLVQFDAGEKRHVLLDTIRDYVRELADPTARERPQSRLMRWAGQFARAANAGLGRAEAAVLDRVARDEDGVRSALDHALRTRTDLGSAAGVVVDLAFAWSLHGRCAEGRAWAARLAAALDPTLPALAWADAFLTTYSGTWENGSGLAPPLRTFDMDRENCRRFWAAVPAPDLVATTGS